MHATSEVPTGLREAFSPAALPSDWLFSDWTTESPEGCWFDEEVRSSLPNELPPEAIEASANATALPGREGMRLRMMAAAVIDSGAVAWRGL